jgi:hypothetical protein
MGTTAKRLLAVAVIAAMLTFVAAPAVAFAVGAQRAAARKAAAKPPIAGRDLVPPVTSYVPPAGWQTAVPVFVTLTANDFGSGVASTWWALDGGSPRTYVGAFGICDDGVRGISYASVDRAGNIERAHTVLVMIDTKPPVTRDDAPGLPVGGPVSVTLTAEDRTSGVRAIWASVDGAPYGAYSGPIRFTAPGEHTIEYFSVDVAGNAESPKIANITISSATL